MRYLAIEFKYVSLNEAKLTGEAARKMDQGKIDHMRCIEKSMNEAINQTRKYADSLNQKYPDLRLKPYAVVTLGFDRISWKAIK